jgi:hypothetical protein
MDMKNLNCSIDFFNMVWYSLLCQGDATAATGHRGTLVHPGDPSWRTKHMKWTAHVPSAAAA